MKKYIQPVYSRQTELAERYGICRNTARSRIHEIQAEMGAGKRYSDGDVITDANLVLVNEFAFLDWLNVRSRWLNPNTRKYVEPFDPSWWAHRTGVDQIKEMD